MQDLNVKNNYFTFPDRRPEKSRDQGEIDEILTKFGSELPYVYTANISGAKIQLRTNSEHVSDFWQLNWYLADAKKAEGTVYVINGLEGYEPHLFYNLDQRKIVIVNSEYYGAAKSAGALGLTGAILQERGGYPIHGGCVAIEKKGKNEGIIIIAPTGTGKTAQSHELTYSLENTKVHSDDYMFIFFDGELMAKATEKQLYMRTDIAEEHPTFIHLFQDLPLENVITEKVKCAQKGEKLEQMGRCYRECSEGERRCVFDEGADRCYWSYGNSRVMFPRSMFPILLRNDHGLMYEAFKGEGNVIDVATVKYVILLTRDEELPPIRKLDIDNAIEVLREGKYTIRPGAGPREKWGKIGYEPFYDPYPPEINMDRQEELYKKLFEAGVLFYLLNTGSHKGRKITTHQTHMYIRHIIGV